MGEQRHRGVCWPELSPLGAARAALRRAQTLAGLGAGPAGLHPLTALVQKQNTAQAPGTSNLSPTPAWIAQAVPWLRARRELSPAAGPPHTSQIAARPGSAAPPHGLLLLLRPSSVGTGREQPAEGKRERHGSGQSVKVPAEAQSTAAI